MKPVAHTLVISAIIPKTGRILQCVETYPIAVSVAAGNRIRFVKQLKADGAGCLVRK
jgi:hypothetical protein